MPPRSNVPIRIGGSRFRTGCRTCKQRHVKCDEHHPICANCQRVNRDCVYDASLPTSRRSSPPGREGSDLTVSRALNYLNQSAWPGVTTSINPSGSLEVFEISAVQHFATLLGKELAGSFSNGVWCDILPRVAQHEPSIWHGIVAISTLDTTHRLNYLDGSARPNQTAITHYGKAIQGLHKRLEGARDALCKDVILLSCILFAVFECLQSHYKSALRHISGGVNLLVEWGGTGQPSNEVNVGSYLDRTALQSVFLTLDSQAIQMGAAGFRDYFPGSALEDQLEAPLTFLTVEDAHLLLTQIFHRLTHWSNWNGPTTACGNRPNDVKLSMEQQKIQRQLNEWDFAFEPLQQLFPNEPAMLLLLLQRKIIQAYFGKELDGPSELAWDKYLPLFEEAVILAEAYMSLIATRSTAPIGSIGGEPANPERPRPVLTIAMDIVLSLVLITTRCRDSGIRRRALRMLRACDRKEGIWDSQVLARMVEKVIEVEEAAALEDGFIPENARMSTLDVRLGEERTAEVSHKALAQDTDGYHHTETFSEDITW